MTTALDSTPDLKSETLVRISDSKTLPCSPHRSTVYKWYKHGVDVGGRIVRLETVRIGRRRYTTLEAFHRFISQTNVDRV